VIYRTLGPAPQLAGTPGGRSALMGELGHRKRPVGPRARGWRLALGVSLAVGLVPFLGCPGSARQPIYDLAGAMWAAERSANHEVLLFGAPATEPHLVSGFEREAGTTDFTWAKQECEIAFTWEKAVDRTVVVDWEPSPRHTGQTVSVALNGAPVGRLALEPRRQRQRVDLPATGQRSGDNRLSFVFGKAAPPAEGDGRRLAARFRALLVLPSEDPSIPALLTPDTPLPFSHTQEEGRAYLIQGVGTTLRYTLRLPRKTELWVKPELLPASRLKQLDIPIEITVAREGSPERVLWSGRVTAQQPELLDLKVALGNRGGEIVRLGLQVGESRARALGWVRWREPRLVGHEPLPSVEPSPFGRQEQARVEQLRRGLGQANVVLVVLDAARAGHFGCYGHSRPSTPEIDRIASDGVLFERAYTPAVYTLGAMSSVWTSQYPDRHHAGILYADSLPKNRLTLTQLLGARAPNVLTYGVTANAMAGRARGLDRGFGEFREIVNDPQLGSRAAVFRTGLHIWLTQHRRDRFFAYAHFREPHFPYDPLPPFNTRFGPDAPLSQAQRSDKSWYTAVNQGDVQPTQEQIDHLARLYDGNLAYADQEVGALRRELEALHLWDKTVFILMADHGEQLYDDGYIGHSAQVREESARVPLIVRFPEGVGPRGVRLKTLVDLTDLAPTIGDILGLPGHGASPEFQGRSLLPVVGGAAGRPAVLTRTVWDRPVYALREGRFKYVYDMRSGEERLFDLERDGNERSNVAPQESLRSAFYRQTLYEWIVRLSNAPVAVAGADQMDLAQCENLCSLGYVDCSACVKLR
jgi:arylsulfatase A-like enzyme